MYTVLQYFFTCHACSCVVVVILKIKLTLYNFSRWIDRDKAEPVEAFIHEWLDLGVIYIGGCCRTYAADVSRIRNQVFRWLNKRYSHSTEPWMISLYYYYYRGIPFRSESLHMEFRNAQTLIKLLNVVRILYETYNVHFDEEKTKYIINLKMLNIIV